MKIAKNRKQSGSVLLTVVSVMSILIVFLFGTMALAVANNNRAHVNYSSAQTGITARAVAESAIDAIGNGTDAGKAYAKAVGELKAGDDPISVKVQLKGDGVGSLGHVQDVVISHAGTKQYYDVNDKEWHSRDLLKFTATVTMSGVESSSSVYVLKHKSDDEESSAGGGAGFVTVSSADLKCQTNIVGGAYISLPDINEARKYVYSNSHVDRALNRTGRAETGEGVIGFGEINGENNSFYLKNSGAIVEADLFVNNNMAIENWGGFIFPGPSTGITVWGDLKFLTNSKDHLNYVYLGSKKTDLAFTEVPYIYVDGNIFGDDGGLAKLGSVGQDFPLNIFCGTINSAGTEWQNSVIAGNLYCMDEGGNSTIKIQNINNPLYNWSESVVKQIKVEERETYVDGEICSNGNLTLSVGTEDLNVYGNVRVKGDLTVEATDGKKVKVHGNVVVGGKINGIDNIEIVDNDEMDGTEQIYVQNAKKPEDAVTADIPNEVGYYYVHTPLLTTKGYVGPDGETLLNDGNVFIDGVYQQGAQVDGNTVPEHAGDLRIYYTLNQVEDENGEMRSVRPTDPESWKYIDYTYADVLYAWEGFSQPENQGHLANIEHLKRPGPGGRDPHNENNLEGFYIETYVVEGSFEEVKGAGPEEGRPGAPGRGPQDDGYYTVRADNGKLYQYKVTTHYSKVTDSTFEYTLPGTGGVTYKHPNEFLNSVNEAEGQIYPKYAERLVILGKETGYEDGKIIKTMEDVIGKVANPYKDYVSADGSEKKPDAVQKLWTAAIANEYNDDKLPDIVDEKYVINKSSCYFDFTNKELERDLVITPDENGTLVIIDKLVVQAGKNIIIDDSGSAGNVYFYINDDGANDDVDFKHCGNANIITKTYYDALFNDSKNDLSYNSGGVNYDIDDKADIADGSPNVYIYGGKNSNMECSNIGIVTANIISPYMLFKVGGGEGRGINSLYYDGYDLVEGLKSIDGTIGGGSATGKQFILGCVNVGSADIPNTLCSVYIPSEAGKGGGGHKKDADWWYKVLYYNEF